jgi:hypothetical protein
MLCVLLQWKKIRAGFDMSGRTIPLLVGIEFGYRLEDRGSIPGRYKKFLSYSM